MPPDGRSGVVGDRSRPWGAMARGRRGLAGSVVAEAVGAGLVLLASARVWSTEVVARPSPMSPQEITHTGASLVPALPALGLVALAGAGGLLATRGRGRRLVGAVLCAVAAGVVMLVAGVLAGTTVRPGWAVTGLLGAVLVGAAGLLAVRVGVTWPVMGSRYGGSRPSHALPVTTRPGRTEPGSTGPAAGTPSIDQQRSAEIWDALERGEDPTRD